MCTDGASESKNKSLLELLKNPQNMISENKKGKSFFQYFT